MRPHDPGRELRVAHVHWTAPPVTGGVEVHCSSLTEQLAGTGMDVRLLSGTPEADTGEYRPVLDIGKKAGDALQIALLAEELAHFDVVHWHNPQWHKPEVTRSVAVALSRGPRRPRCVIFDVHNISDDPAQWAFLDQCPFDLLMVHSAYVRDQVRSRLPRLSPVVAPLAMNRTSARARLPARRPVVLQPTRLSRWKGSDLALRAAARLLGDGVRFTFVHAGTQNAVWPAQMDDVLEEVSPWRRDGSIVLTHYGWRQSWDAIASADIVVHPTADRGTRGEPYSLTVAQAVICGRPLIASDSGNLPELLADYEPKKVVSAGDLDELADAMHSLIANPPPGPGPRGAALAARLETALATSGRWHGAMYRQRAGVT
jgi:glycosyltransferase involved in cell wall biosynthesis